jgi:cobalt-zinc-cadmium efflux system protein
MAEHHHKKHSEHTHNHGIQGKNLLAVSLLNLIITIVEIVGGLVSNSLALLSDAFHNLGDTFAVILAYFANRIGKRDATERKTFGYKRIEILAALLNACILIGITVFLFIEAYQRLLDPQPVKGLIMLIVSTVGLIANLIAVLLLRKDSDHNLNIKAAYLHLLGDTISSVAVIIGAVMIFFYKLYWIDPVVTFLVGIYILKEAWVVLKETVDILMQSTPSSIDIHAIVGEIEKIEEINNVHHVHAWKLDDEHIHFECHADLDLDLPLSKADKIRLVVEKLLYKKFGITHATIQFEYNCCNEKSLIHKSSQVKS